MGYAPDIKWRMIGILHSPHLNKPNKGQGWKCTVRWPLWWWGGFKDAFLNRMAPFHSIQMTLHRIYRRPTGENFAPLLLICGIHVKLIYLGPFQIQFEKQLLKFNNWIFSKIGRNVGFNAHLKVAALLTLIGRCQDFNPSFLMAVCGRTLRDPKWRRWRMKMLNYGALSLNTFIPHVYNALNGYSAT